MAETTEELVKQYAEARDAANALHERIRLASLAALPYAVGDTVRVPSANRVGRVTGVRFSITKENKVIMRPSILPIKKDGQKAKVGAIFVWYDDVIELVEKAELAEGGR